jgi:hypothetical protein
MKAVVYHRPGHVEVNDVDDPTIQLAHLQWFLSAAQRHGHGP